MLELAPDGFEERETPADVELAAYVPAPEASRIRERFPGARVERVEPGWEDAWRRFHRPVRIGRLWVGPPWEEPDPDAVAVVVDPGRAFGTGAHATTRLCLELLQELPLGSLVDLGCGSGVLAVAAAKLGFRPVLALDADPAAVEVTRENAVANAVALDVRQADVVDGTVPPADVAVANVSLAVVRAAAGRVRADRLLTSGYRVDDAVDLTGWRLVARREADGWAAHVFAPASR